MWFDLLMLDAPAANAPARMMVSVGLGLAGTWAGMVLLVKPERLAKLLRRGRRFSDLRSYFAEDLERSPWKARMVGAFAILWGVLFVVLGFNIMLSFIG